MVSKHKEQINLWVEQGWKEKFKALARKRSYETNTTVSYLELIYEVLLVYLSGSSEKRNSDG